MSFSGCLTLLNLLMLAACGCASPPKPFSLARFEYNQPEMGVPFRIVLYAPDKATADESAMAAFARIELLNNIFSDYESDSELSALSDSAGCGKAIKVSPELWRVLSRSQDLAQKSSGAFDITCGPCVSLWRKARREHKLPDPARLQEARSGVGFKKLRLDPRNRT